MGSNPGLRVDNLTFSFGEKKILENLSFSLAPGEIVALIGVSGSGKTTLFRLITGALKPQTGSIEVNSPLTYMRQEDLLLPWRTILGNLLLLTELGRGGKQERDRATALRLLERVGLAECADLYPHQLSGGMRQRVALARALMQERPLLLLDEPFGSLDVLVREELYGLLAAAGKTVLLVTHDFRDALALASRVLILGGGRITAEFSCKEEGLLKKVRLALAACDRNFA